MKQSPVRSGSTAFPLRNRGSRGRRPACPAAAFLPSLSILATLSLPAACLAAGDRLDVLEAAAARTLTLEADFSQTKNIPFMDVPLLSSGKLCFDISNKASPFIFWEYRKPEKTGFSLTDGSPELWAPGGTEVSDPAQKKMLASVVNEMLLWMAFDRKALEVRYALETPDDRTVRLTPKRDGLFFTRAELRFSSDLAHVERIMFTGAQGDETVTLVTGARINSGLSPDCAR